MLKNIVDIKINNTSGTCKNWHALIDIKELFNLNDKCTFCVIIQFFFI